MFYSMNTVEKVKKISLICSKRRQNRYLGKNRVTTKHQSETRNTVSVPEFYYLFFFKEQFRQALVRDDPGTQDPATKHTSEGLQAKSIQLTQCWHRSKLTGQEKNHWRDLRNHWTQHLTGREADRSY